MGELDGPVTWWWRVGMWGGCLVAAVGTVLDSEPLLFAGAFASFDTFVLGVYADWCASADEEACVDW